MKATRRKKAPTRQGEEQWRLRKKAEAPFPVEGWEDGPFGEWANNLRRMRDLKGRNIRALVDDERVTVVSGESEKSCVAPLGNVSRRRVKTPIDVVLVARKGGENKNLETGEKRRRRGGGRSIRRRGGGREKHPRRRRISKRIHNNIFFLTQR